MKNRIKTYLKGKNPYLLASAAVVILSVLAIFLILQEDGPTESAECEEPLADAEYLQEETVAFVETQEEITAETAPLLESEVPEEETRKEEETPAKMEESGEEADEGAETSKGSEANAALESTPKPEETAEAVEAPEEPDPDQVEDVPEEAEQDEPESEKVPVSAPEEVPEEAPQETNVPKVHEHSWVFESVYQKPTCSNGGLVNQICAHCGETQVTSGTPTGEHTFEVEVAGDCCSEEVVKCAECNFREVREKNPEDHIDAEDGFCYGCGQEIG